MPDLVPWPALDYAEWQDTATTLHMWTQIVGKTRLALTPMQNHWWNVPLYVSTRGLTTSPMPVETPGKATKLLEIEFDFRAHVLHFRVSTGVAVNLPLRAQSVAEFFADYRDVLVALGVEIRIDSMPVEVQSPVRFEQDHKNASYDEDAVERFHRVLMQTDTLFRRFSTGFTGKISPVHFFWGSFDLCVTRFSGRPASGPAKPDRMQQEAYSHEVISCGFWPGNGGYGAAAFYCYAAPVPAGLAERRIEPGAWDAGLGEFLLRYDDVRESADPGERIFEFLMSSYGAAAESAGWDREGLDRPVQTAPASR